MKRRKPKRYVLIEAEGELSPPEFATLTRLLEQRHGKLTVIELESPRTAFIVKTDRPTATALRESLEDVVIGETRVRTKLTSGAIGKLKRSIRGSSARVVGKVSE